MARPAHFEINAGNPEQAVEFYRKTFGWEISKWDGPMEYWLVRTGLEEPGIDGAIFNSGGLFSGTVNTIGVENIEQALDKVKANGGQQVTDLQPIPGIGRFAYCKDVAGNLFGMLQPDMGADG
jgi:uncharacterized protein